MNDRPAFTSALAVLASTLPAAGGRQVSEATYEVYWRALAPLGDAEFQRAAERALRTCTFFPTPAELLALARGQIADQGASAHLAMLRAWNAGRQTIPGEGSWWSGDAIRAQEGEAASEAFHACGGSSAFRDIDDPYHGPRIRREFMECYQRVTAAEPTKALPVPGATVKALPTRELLALARGDGPTHAAPPPPPKPTLTRPERLPCTPEEQAQLDRLAEKIAAKRLELARPTTRVSEGATP